MNENLYRTRAERGEIQIGTWVTMIRTPAVLTLLKAGEVRVQTPDGAEQHFFVGGGALEVQPTRVTVLADTALRAKDLDEAAALAAKQRAEDSLRGVTDKVEQAELMKEIVRMTEQVKLIQKLRKGK